MGNLVEVEDPVVPEMFVPGHEGVKEVDWP
jgi:hypothetical protein